MALNLLKLCVGAKSIDDLIAWQNQLQRTYGRVFHTTRMVPKRDGELLDNGSIYWVINGQIQCRQSLLDIEVFNDRLGKRRCHLILDPSPILTRIRAQRPFQGWRYLTSADAPSDLAAGAEIEQDMPDEMRAELSALGLI